MAISYVSGAESGAATLTMPSHATGDLIIAYAVGTSAVTLPGDWTNLESWDVGSLYGRLAYKIAASGSESAGTWTNAAFRWVLVYRTTLVWELPTHSRWTSNAAAAPINLANPGNTNNWFARMGYAAVAQAGWTRRFNNSNRYGDDTGGNVSVASNSVGGNDSASYIVTVGISDNPPPPTGLPVKQYISGTWTQIGVAKAHDGTNWVKPKYWDGTAWV